jgi:hypothetical protein
MLLPAEWSYLRAATLKGGTHHEMNPLERVTLYATAIQTGLRSGELRSITKGDLFLAGEAPYVRCKGENTKNGKEARQYIQQDLAGELWGIVASKTPAAPVFNLPDEWRMAEMLREDLGAARTQWLDEVKHDDEARAKRQESDFLAMKNHEGETFDFHSLRHSCGSWLALQGVQVNVIKTVMRHSSITLTMETYGHLLPDQHADAVGGMVAMLPKVPEAATGTAGKAVQPPPVQRTVGMQNSANGCETMHANDGTADVRQTLEFTRKSEDRKAKTSTGPGRIRTCNQGIMSPLLCR